MPPEADALPARVFTGGTLFSEWIDYCAGLDPLPCAPALEWMRAVDGPGLTFRQAMQLYRKAPESEASSAWAAWALAHQHARLSVELRRGFAYKIKNDSLARRLHDRLGHLTAPERAVLRTAFHGKLPNWKRKGASHV